MANTSLKKIFDGQTSDANSASEAWPGGVGQMVGAGTWGGGTLKIQMSPDDGTTWVDIGGWLTDPAPDGIWGGAIMHCPQ